MMGSMTSRERVLAAFRGDECDRPPLFTPASLANLECMRLSKSFFPYANLNATKIAALAETSHSILGFDSVMPYFGIANEAGALGCNVDWGGVDRFPNVYGGILQSLNDFKKPSNYLDRKPLQAIINAVSLLKRQLQEQVAIVGKILGPLSLVFYLYGIQNTLNSLILEPDALIDLLNEVKDLCVAFAHAQIGAGADIITISEDAAGDLISRECYRRIAMDVEKSIFEALGNDAYVVFHLSCDVLDRADLIRDTGFHALSYDTRSDLPRLKSMVGDMKLIGGVNNPVTLLNGSLEDISREVYYALDNGVSLISPECAIPLHVSNDNVMGIRDAVIQYRSRKLKKIRTDC